MCPKFCWNQSKRSVPTPHSHTNEHILSLSQIYRILLCSLIQLWVNRFHSYWFDFRLMSSDLVVGMSSLWVITSKLSSAGATNITSGNTVQTLGPRAALLSVTLKKNIYIYHFKPSSSADSVSLLFLAYNHFKNKLTKLYNSYVKNI